MGAPIPRDGVNGGWGQQDRPLADPSENDDEEDQTEGCVYSLGQGLGNNTEEYVRQTSPNGAWVLTATEDAGDLFGDLTQTVIVGRDLLGLVSLQRATRTRQSTTANIETKGPWFRPVPRGRGTGAS